MSIVKSRAPKTSMVLSPKGSFTVSNSEPIRRPATMSRTMKIPTVTVAAENAGLPTMGLSATRSMNNPMTAMTTMPSTTASQKGRPMALPNAPVKKAPRTMSAGVAKLITPVAL